MDQPGRRKAIRINLRPSNSKCNSPAVASPRFGATLAKASEDREPLPAVSDWSSPSGPGRFRRMSLEIPASAKDRCRQSQAMDKSDPSKDGRASPATLAAVAKIAGVGLSTASRVLRGHGSFSTKARDEVLAAAAELGYVSNRIAGSLASTASRLVAIVVPSPLTSSLPTLSREQTARWTKRAFNA